MRTTLLRPRYALDFSAVLFILTPLIAVHGNENQGAPADQGAIPLEWRDPETGYRIIRLSRRNGPNLSFYFHNNPFVRALGEDGDKMVFFGSTDNGMQLFTIDLKSLEIQQLTDQPAPVRGEIVSGLRREAFYQSDDQVFAVNVDTGTSRHVATLPEGLNGSIRTVNADGSQLAGTSSRRQRNISRRFPQRADYFDRIFEAKPPSKLFTLEVNTGTVKIVHEENAWLNHLQFSPIDPQLLMFCHEGPWHKLHRIWLINVGTSKIRKIHERTVPREIAGHEFWSCDGRTIWFDLQIPRGETFYLAGYHLKSAQETRYSVTRNEWSVHYNNSPDQLRFCGDGGDGDSVAQATDGKWIYLFEPEGAHLRATRLASLRDHDYELEPNAHFSPDGRWIIFRSNMHEQTHIYAVEVDSAPEI